MKKLKVLIIENGSGLSGVAAKLMAEIFSDFDCQFGAEFFYLKKYQEAMQSPQEDLILNGYYGLLVLIGENDSLALYDVEDNLFVAVKKVIKLFISPSDHLIEKMKECPTDFTHCFSLINNEITDRAGADIVREALIESGNISQQISPRKIVNPVSIFCQSLQEKSAEKLELVTNLLNREEIRYSIVGGLLCGQVFIESVQVPVVKKLIRNSNLEFWNVKEKV